MYYIIIARAERVPTRTGGLSLLFVPRPGFIKVRSSAVYMYNIFLHPVYYYYCIPSEEHPSDYMYTCTAHVHAFVYNTAATASTESVCPSPCESSRAALYTAAARII